MHPQRIAQERFDVHGDWQPLSALFTVARGHAPLNLHPVRAPHSLASAALASTNNLALPSVVAGPALAASPVTNSGTYASETGPDVVWMSSCVLYASFWRVAYLGETRFLVSCDLAHDPWHHKFARRATCENTQLMLPCAEQLVEPFVELSCAEVAARSDMRSEFREWVSAVWVGARPCLFASFPGALAQWT